MNANDDVNVIQSEPFSKCFQAWFLRCAGWDTCSCSLNLFVHTQATSPFNHTAVVLRILGPSITACTICPDYTVHRLSEHPQEWSPSEWGCEIQKGFHSAAECSLTRLLSNPRDGTRVTECHMTVMGRRGAEYSGEEACRYVPNYNDWSNDAISALSVVLHSFQGLFQITLAWMFLWYRPTSNVHFSNLMHFLMIW